MMINTSAKEIKQSDQHLEKPTGPVESYVGPIAPEVARRKKELVGADEAVVA